MTTPVEPGLVLADEDLANLVVLADCDEPAGRFLCLKNDFYIGRALTTYRAFSPGEGLLFRTMIRPGMYCVDAGANIGLHTVTMARAAHPGGLVAAFEPLQFLYHLLCGNLALAGLQNVRAFQYAVGAKTGTIKVPIIEWRAYDNFGGTPLANHPYGRVNVQQVTLDECLPRIDFLKADVEGMELAVLQGASKRIKEHPPICYLEANTELAQRALIEFLLGHGYTPERIYLHTPRLCEVDPNVFGQTVSLNILALPEGVARPEVPDLSDLGGFA